MIGLHFGHGAIALGAAQAAKIQLAHLFGIHALGGQRAQTAFQARINLVLHQRFGNGKRDSAR